MGEATKIQWTDKTWNPVRGCSIVSPGCHHCYAATLAHRFSGPGQPYEGLVEKRGGKVRWTGKVRCVPEKLAEPPSWRKPAMVFVNSMSDLFHEEIPDEFIAAVFGVMAACPRHTFQILTKRISRAADWFRWIESEYDGPCGPMAVLQVAAGPHMRDRDEEAMSDMLDRDWPLPNVWLGVSCEDQATADERIPALFQVPAAVRFLSCEPLLSPIDLTRVRRQLRGESSLVGSVLEGDDGFGPNAPRNRIDWIICGGESGPGARPCDVAWIRSIVDQCKAATVPVFVKQMGSRPFDSDAIRAVPDSGRKVSIEEAKSPAGLALLHECLVASDVRLRDPKGGAMDEWPDEALKVREFPGPTEAAR